MTQTNVKIQAQFKSLDGVTEDVKDAQNDVDINNKGFPMKMMFHNGSGVVPVSNLNAMPVSGTISITQNPIQYKNSSGTAVEVDESKSQVLPTKIENLAPDITNINQKYNVYPTTEKSALAVTTAKYNDGSSNYERAIRITNSYVNDNSTNAVISPLQVSISSASSYAYGFFEYKGGTANNDTSIYYQIQNLFSSNAQGKSIRIKPVYCYIVYKDNFFNDSLGSNLSSNFSIIADITDNFDTNLDYISDLTYPHMTYISGVTWQLTASSRKILAWYDKNSGKTDTNTASSGSSSILFKKNDLDDQSCVLRINTYATSYTIRLRLYVTGIQSQSQNVEQNYTEFLSTTLENAYRDHLYICARFRYDQIN